MAHRAAAILTAAQKLTGKERETSPPFFLFAV